MHGVLVTRFRDSPWPFKENLRFYYFLLCCCRCACLSVELCHLLKRALLSLQVTVFGAEQQKMAMGVGLEFRRHEFSRLI